MVKNRACIGAAGSAGGVDNCGAIPASFGAALTARAGALGAGALGAGAAAVETVDCIASAMTNGSFVRASFAGFVAGSELTAAAVKKPTEASTNSQRAAPCARAIALMFNTPFRGVDRLL